MNTQIYKLPFNENRGIKEYKYFVHIIIKIFSIKGLCYLMFGAETKRSLLPSQVTGIDTVKALFVRSFTDKLTMNYMDDEQLVKIYIKDQLKDLFYQLDDMK